MCRECLLVQINLPYHETVAGMICLYGDLMEIPDTEYLKWADHFLCTGSAYYVPPMVKSVLFQMASEGHLIFDWRFN